MMLACSYDLAAVAFVCGIVPVIAYVVACWAQKRFR